MQWRTAGQLVKNTTANQREEAEGFQRGLEASRQG